MHADMQRHIKKNALEKVFTVTHIPWADEPALLGF